MTSKGTSPANLDLFLRVEEEVIRLEKENIPVSYPFIPFNFDSLIHRRLDFGIFPGFTTRLRMV
jgi:hypothetical protein